MENQYNIKIRNTKFFKKQKEQFHVRSCTINKGKYGEHTFIDDHQSGNENIIWLSNDVHNKKLIKNGTTIVAI